MKKKYSDPLMFSAILLDDIIAEESSDGEIGPMKSQRLASPRLMMNSSSSKGATESVSIVPNETAAAADTEIVTEEASGGASTTVLPPVEEDVTSVIDEVAPVEAASTDVTE